MRLIAVINEKTEIRKILMHLGEPHEPPKISPARGPPLWDACDEASVTEFDAEYGEVFDAEPDWDAAQQSTPDVQYDQSVTW